MKNVSKRLREDHISEFAAECAYYTLLSIVPFIIFFITLIQFMMLDKKIILSWIGQFVPSNMYTFIINIIEEVYSRSLNTVSISLIIALWSASKGFYALCKGLKNIYRASEKKSNFMIRLEGFAFTLLFIIILIVVMIFFIFGNRIHNFILKYFFSYGKITSFLLRFRILFTITLLFFTFLLLYRFIPRHKVSFKSQILGAVFSSIAWIISSFVFSVYIDIFKGFSNTYGSLSSIIAVMMWIYVCMYIILLGAEINKYLSNV